MKQGRSLTELAAELERQHTTKRDFITDTRELELVPRLMQKDGGKSITKYETLRLDKGGESVDFTPTKHTVVSTCFGTRHDLLQDGSFLCCF